MAFIKNNKIKVLISSLLILSPIVAGLILWDKLPESVPIHWGINGEPDSFAGKGVAVFLMPCIMFALHFVCLIATSFDKRYKSQNKKVLQIVFWIVPAVTIAVQCAVFGAALGYDFDVSSFILPLIAVMFIFIGNYMPKATQNRVYGIRIPWTMKSEANWDATHRFAGKLWVICGILALPLIFIPHPVKFWLLFALIFLAVLPPLFYSYIYYRKHK